LFRLDRVLFEFDFFSSYNFSIVSSRFVGQYDFFNPMVMIKDMELLKKITIKDFEHFVDRRTTVDEKVEPVFGRSLFLLKGMSVIHTSYALSPKG
jgi:cytochrome P450 family 9